MGPLLDREIVDGSWVSLDGERHYAGRHYTGYERWSFVGLRAARAIGVSRILGITVTLIFAVLSLAYFVRMERLVRDQIALAKRLALEEHARELELRANRDPLTGLSNRMKFNQELAAEIERWARYRTPLSLVMYDIDHFKAVNDIHGHAAGDRVLVGLSLLVAGHIRKTDTLARWGGEEFMILAPNCDDQQAVQLAEKLRNLIEQSVFDEIGTVTCSFGVAQFQNGDTAESFTSRADEALYAAKQAGRNYVRAFGQRKGTEIRQ